MKLQSSLRASAPVFVPSWAAAVAPPAPIVIDESYYEQRPHSPGSNGFVIADGFFSFMDIPDEELFDAKLHPLTAEELAELEQIDEVNNLLAELDIMETHQELHHQVAEFRKEKQSSNEYEIEVRNLKNKQSKPQNRNKMPSGPKKQLHCHMKKQSFAPLQQPRSVN
jgi:hypothetical protein